MIVAIVGVWILLVIGVIALQMEIGKKKKLIAKGWGGNPPPENTYGHHFSPLGEVKRGLHKPPTGFMWELFVEYEHQRDRSDPILKVQLMEVASGKVVASNSANLGYDYSVGYTYTESYSRYGSATLKSARLNIVTRLAKWSEMEFRKRNTADDGPQDYTVIA